MDTGVIESRAMEDDTVIRRRRYCKKCKKRFTTHERIELVPLIVIKKNENREVFDRGKIIKGIIKACEKRPISLIQINQITKEIEEKLNVPVIDGLVCALMIIESFLRYGVKTSKIAKYMSS